MSQLVRLTTVAVQSPVSVHHFQFGTVPAPSGCSGPLETTVPAGSTNVDVFWFDPAIVVPEGENVRFDIRFEINVHNSAMLQVSLDGTSAGTQVVWRWAAPIGEVGQWSTARQTAPWSDDSVDYSITITPDGTDGTTIDVTLTEHRAATG